MFAGFGDPGATAADSTRFGVWITDNLGDAWTKITGGSALDGEPVLDLLPVDDQTVLVGTAGLGLTGHGGLWRGVFQSGSWGWTRVVAQQRLTAVARSPFNPKVGLPSGMFGGLPPAETNPGIYRTYDGGTTWTGPVARNGLDNLTEARLDFSTHDRRKVYASTKGAGVFEGTFPCNSNNVCDADEVAGICRDCASKAYFLLSAVSGGDPTLTGVSGTIAKTDIVSYDPASGAFARFFQGTSVGIPSMRALGAFTKLSNGICS